MALFVYRYRLKTPVLESQLEVEVGVPLSITDYAGGGVVDIECDDSRAQDLIDAMESRGYEFVEGSPATTSAERFRSDTGIVNDDRRIKVTLADTVPDFLQAKLLAGESIGITKEGTGVDEKLRIAASISDIFSTDYDTSVTPQTTSSFTPQDAGLSVTAPVNGDYIIFFSTDNDVSNTRGTMAIALSTVDTLTEFAPTVRRFRGLGLGNSLTFYPYIGLSAGQVITALFRMETSPGNASIYNRAMFLQRIG